ncbi:MAG: hypothetical protein EOM40_05015 [Clostridia bacterium]|nr:hypothetical protein [Clostridia bacterium]NCC42105.1 hypothetical protein [Clostridia bacterium]
MKTVFCNCFCIIKGESVEQKGDIWKVNKALYLEQEAYEQKYKQEWEQAFVFGSSRVECRDFRRYPLGYRAAVDYEGDGCSEISALMLACKLLRDRVKAGAGEKYQLTVISDRKLKLDDMKFYYENKLRKFLRENDIEVKFVDTNEDSNML